MGYSTTAPIQGDNKIVLLKKLLQAWGGTVPNGPLNEREVLRLLLARVGAVVPAGPHTDAELLALLLAAFQSGSGSCANLSGVDADPNGIYTATFIGQIFLSAAGEGSVWQATALGDNNWNDVTPTPAPTPDTAFIRIEPSKTAFSTFTLDGNDGNVYELSDAISFPTLTAISDAFYFKNFSSVTSLSIPNLVSIAQGFDFDGCSGMQILSFPALESIGDGFYALNCGAITTIDIGNVQSIGNGIDLTGNTELASLSISSLETVTGSFSLDSCTSLTTLDLASLVSISGQFIVSGCSALVTVSCPQWLPTDGNNLTCSGCAMSASSVNQILARCVAAGVTTCTIDLSGGTSAAPTGQGIADKAALILAGNAVTTN